MNFVAVVASLNVSPSVTALALAADNIIGLLYFPAASALTPQARAGAQETGSPLCPPPSPRGVRGNPRSERAPSEGRPTASAFRERSCVAARSRMSIAMFRSRQKPWTELLGIRSGGQPGNIVLTGLSARVQ